MESLLVLFSAISLSHYFLKKFNFYYSIIIVFVLVNFIRVEDLSSSLWIPYRLTAPYIALLVCFLHIQNGCFKFLAFSVLLSVMLIHGYIAMPLFTVPFLILCLVIGFVRSKKEANIVKCKWQIFISMVVIVIFFAPILIDTIYSSAAVKNVPKIFTALFSYGSMPKASWQEVRVFCGGVFFQRNAVTSICSMILLSAVLIVSKIDNNLRVKIFSALCLCFLVVLVVVLFCKLTPSPLYAYIGVFCVGAYVLLITTLVSLLFSSECLISNNFFYDKVVKSLFVLLVILLICLPLKFAQKNSGTSFTNPLIGEFADQIEASQSNACVSIDYEELEQWPFIAGLLLELDLRGINACTVQRVVTIYTDKMVCPRRVGPNYKIIKATNCGNDCLFEKGGVGLVRCGNTSKP